MKMPELMAQAREEKNPALIIDAIPYARMLGISYDLHDGDYRYILKGALSNVGNASRQVIHGGVIGGFMESAGVIQLIMMMRTLKMPKIVNFSIDYLRAAEMQDTYAQCQVVREGNKFANLHIEAWQGERTNLVARARANVLISL